MMLALVLMAGSLSCLHAQFGQARIHLAPSIPMGTFGAEEEGGLNAGFGLGGTANLDFFFNDEYHIGLEGSIIRYDQVVTFNNQLEDGYYTLIPLQLTGGFHTGALNYLDLYAGIGAGAFLIERTFVEGFMDQAFGESATLWGVSPRLGLSYELTSTLRLDLNLGVSYIIGNEEMITEEHSITIDDQTITYVTTSTGYPDLLTLNLNLGLAAVLFE